MITQHVKTSTYRRALSNIEPITTMLADIGSFQVRNLHRLLAERLGPMQFVRFDEPAWIDPGTIVWNGILESGQVVSGELALRAAVLNGGELVVGAEVTVLPTAAERVARRHSGRAAGKLFTTRLEEVEVTYSDGGVITAQDVERMIEPHVGQVFQLAFRKPLTGRANTVAWKALDTDGDLVWGSLVLHAGVRDSQVVSWAEIRLDKPVGFDFRKQGSSEARDAQLENIAKLGRDLIRKLHTKPRVATPELLGAIVAMVDEAEREV